MKHLYILLLVSTVAFSQTAEDRKKITASYNQSVISELNDSIRIMENDQKLKIADYKKTHAVKDSETKSLQRIYNGVPIFFTTYNAGSSQTIGTNTMYPGGSLGLSVTGAGMVAGVWDGSKVRDTHIELTGRVTPSDAATGFSSHATHVTGTILASGVSTTRKGIAYGAMAHTYDWTSDISEMSAFGGQGFVASNHSYGYNTESLPTSTFGSYDASSIQIDQVSNAYPFYQIVVAAGNDRNNTNLEQVSLKGGYDMVTGFSTSKNGLSVAAVEQVTNYVNSSSVNISSFSNFGPTDDGRIKPDISAKGVDVNSCGSLTNSQYAILSGTSMAAPAITGMVLMIQKHYNNLYASFMRASTVRGLICHSAKEAGAAQGPDYGYGWGLADANKAAIIISGKGVSTVLEENTLSPNQTFTKQITVTSPQSIAATICWTDPTAVASVGEDDRTPRIKNNLDLKILKDGITYYPWKLNVEDPTAAATRDSDNEVDNVEKVEIDNAQPGVYTIQVTHKGTALVTGSQVFSLIASGSAALSLGVGDVDFEDNIVLYPNPAKNTLNFAVPYNAEIASVAVFDVLGKQVNIDTQMFNNTLDVSHLSKGIYFAKFVYDNKLLVKKFIKE